MALHKLYGPSLVTVTNGEWSWMGGAVKCLLCTSAYVPNQDAHRYRSDLTNELPTGGGYVLGGVTLIGKSNPYAAATNTLALSSSNITFPAVTLAARYAIFYVDTGTSGTSPLISYVDFGSTQSPASQDLQLAVNAGGLVNFQAA